MQKLTPAECQKVVDQLIEGMIIENLTVCPYCGKEVNPEHGYLLLHNIKPMSNKDTVQWIHIQCQEESCKK